MESQRPFSLQELLKFAIAQSESGANDNVYKEMDEERKQFLEDAFKSMTIDVIAELMKAIGILENIKSTDAEKCDALNLVRDYIDNIDFANSFAKLGGTNILKTHLLSKNEQVQTVTVNIIAEMAQNNPFCQQHFLDNNFLELILKQIDKDKELSSSFLYAVSGLVNNFEHGLAALIKLDGCKIILNCVETPFSRVFNKATFLISTLCSQYILVKDRFVLMGAFDKVAQNLEVVTDFDMKTEIVLRALVELATSTQLRIEEHKKLLLMESLKDIIAKNQNLPQCEEIVAYSEKLLNLLTS